MRVTMGAVIIAIGIGLLWLAATGNLDRIGRAWRQLVGPTDEPEKKTGDARTGDAPAPASDRGMMLVLPPLPEIRV